MRKKRSGVHDLDIKAIEIQVPAAVEDLFSEMEPRVNFSARSVREENSCVNSHAADAFPKRDMFALKDVQEKDGDDGDWSNDDEDWNERQVDQEDEAGDETAAASEST